MNQNKNIIQESAINSWIENNRKGTLMAINEVLKEFIDSGLTHEFKALIIVPTTNLRDNEWINECKKWFPHLEKYITIECIQTVYKWNKLYLEGEYSFSIVIVDEIHTTLSPEYRIIYSRNIGEYWCGLTATPPHIEEYREFLEKVCPIIFRLNMEEAVSLQLISPYIIENVGVKFNRKEAAKYKSYTKMYNTALFSLSRTGNAFEAAQKYKGDKKHPLYKMANQFWTGMSLRRWVCYKAESKLEACVNIIKHIPKNKWIIFSQHTDFVDKLADRLREEGILAISYHSKIKTKDKAAVLQAASSPLCRVICSAQALNTGYNLPDIDAAICVASTGTELTFIQQLGRSSRLNENNLPKTSLFINLLVENTQESTWIKNKLDTEDLEIKSVEQLIRQYS